MQPDSPLHTTHDNETDPWQLPGVIGAEVARYGDTVERLLHAVRSKKYLSSQDLQALEGAMQGVRRVARESQQLSRLASGSLRQALEQLGLHEVLSSVLDENDWRFYMEGVTVEHRMRAVDVLADPGLLVSLCEAALEAALHYGQALTLSLGVTHWPQNAELVLRVRPHVHMAHLPLTALPESVEWALAARLAAAMGVQAVREVAPDHAVIRLTFPRTLHDLEGITAMEVDTGGHGVDGAPRSFAGHSLLLISPDKALRWEVDEICRTMGLRMEVVASAGEAVRHCERGKPHLVVIDEHAHDDTFDALRDDLVRHDVNFACVEILLAPNIVQMACWNGHTSRVSRDSLRAQLPSLLALELGRAL